MEAMNYSEARKRMAQIMDQVCDNHDPLIITRQRGRSVVMLSLEDYESIQETAYLLRSPANARRLGESIRQAEGGVAQTRDLIEE